MSTTTIPGTAKAHNADAAGITPGDVAPWRTVLVVAAILVAQVALIDRLVGEEFLSLTTTFLGRRFLRKELFVAALAMAGVVQHIVRQRPEVFRLAALPLKPLAGQGLAFLLLFAFLAGEAAGLPQQVLGEYGTDLVAGILAIGWMASPLLLLPTGSRRLFATAAFTAGLVLTAIGVAETVRDTFWRLSVDTTLDLVEVLLTPFAGAPVVRPKQVIIGTEGFRVMIGSPCSGAQGVALIAVLLAGYLWWFRRMHRFPQALLLLPIGVALMFFANAVRITALVLVGIWISPTIAVDGFHSYAGWIAFLSVGFGTIWAASQMPFFTHSPALLHDTPASGVAAGASRAGAAPRLGAGQPSAPTTTCGPSVAACLAPFLALLVTTILTGAFSSHGSLDLLYPLRVLVVAAVLWSQRHELRGLVTRVSPLAVVLGAAVCVIWMALAPAITAADPEAAAALDPAQLGPVWGPAWLIVRLLGYTVTVPIAEELAFRGYLARRLVSEQVEQVPLGTFTWLSFVGSSLAFGLLHGGAWIPGTLAGAGFALAFYHRRRLTDAIVAHATTNALLAIYAIATGSWNALG